MSQPDHVETLDIAKAEWYDCVQWEWRCPPGCPPEEDCDHAVEIPRGRQLEFTYTDGSTGILTPFDIEDVCGHISEISLS